jgi:hypothetical protein
MKITKNEHAIVLMFMDFNFVEKIRKKAVYIWESLGRPVNYECTITNYGWGAW